MESKSLFSDFKSAILLGEDRPLLNWVAYAFASLTDREFLWVNVESKGEVVAEGDVLARGLIAPDRFSSVRAGELAPSDATANIAVSGVIRGDEPPDNLQRLLDFLRLPERTQAKLSSIVASGRPKVVVLSNAHRLASFYPVEIVGRLLRAIGEAGAQLIVTFADAPNEGRFAFDVILHLEGHDPKNWRQAKLRVEKVPPTGLLRAGSEQRLGEIGPIATVLAPYLG